jgi:integrase
MTTSEPAPSSVLAARQRNDTRDPRLPLDRLFDPEIARQLWDSLPATSRVDHFDKTNMPDALQASVVPTSAGGPWTTVYLNFRGLPEAMTQELVWVQHREAGLGRKIHPNAVNSATRLLRVATQNGGRAGRSAPSLLSLTAEQWIREAQAARLKGVDLGRVNDRHAVGQIRRWQNVLVYAYHRGEWWRLDVWNPMLDRRVPQRQHEPQGQHVGNFSHLHTDWLREAAKWWMSIQLETGHYSWSTVKTRLDGLKWLQRHLDDEGDAGPTLVKDDDELRDWSRRFVQRLRVHITQAGPNKGNPLGNQQRRMVMTTVEQFYRFMFDNRRDAARVLNEPRWLNLRAHHTGLFRPEDKPRLTNHLGDDLALEDAVITQIAAGAELLARAKDNGGIADLQAFNALMLLIRTGRRINEILMMDFEPLIPLVGHSTDGPDGFVARMRYQRTKVLSPDPASIPVDAEIVSIIRAQQQIARDLMTSWGAGDREPRYLFLSAKNNRLGRTPYSAASLHARLAWLTEKLNLCDSVGRPVSISRTHRFRHTRATNLLNAGVQLHVVMRYFGHVTPAMTMHYAKTLSQTAEQEFRRFQKITADGRELQMRPEDLYDVLQLDQRADRVLPNGWCLLPPKQTCERGNACLTCPVFTTDESHRGELTRQRDATDALVGIRQSAFEQRFGAPMPDDNIWLAGRRQEHEALNRVLIALDQVKVRPGAAVRGAGNGDLDPSQRQSRESE